jgi:hypothetical protein
MLVASIQIMQKKINGVREQAGWGYLCVRNAKSLCAG